VPENFGYPMKQLPEGIGEPLEMLMRVDLSMSMMSAELKIEHLNPRSLLV
jgi:hypothetical protein